MQDLLSANTSAASDASLKTNASAHRVLSVDQFELLEQLGSGSFGTVYKARDLVLERTCAIKKIDMDETSDDIEEIQREITILAECYDEHITRYYGSFVNGYKLWIIMEYLGGGSCLDLLRVSHGISEPVVAWILKELLQGLEYLHANRKIHRDIKAANILVAEDGAVKIADFGVATKLSSNLSHRNTLVGTPFWMAPEVIKEKDYSYPADIWSVGITAMELANGEPPLSHLPPMKAVNFIARNPPPVLSNAFSREFRDFVNQCLRRSPNERSTVPELLKHRFLAKASRKEMVRLVKGYIAARVPKPASSIPPTVNDFNFASIDDDDDDWDFDTVRPEGTTASSTPSPVASSTTSSTTSLATSSATSSMATSYCAPPRPSLMSTSSSSSMQSQNSKVPSPIPSPEMSETNINTIKTIQETMRDRRGPLLRIFSHAAQRFDDAILAEIADALAVEPLTMEVENYLVKKIGRVAVDKLDIRPKDNRKRLDQVEDILLAKWLAEAQKRHA